MALTDDLERLHALFQKGALTPEEFVKAKAMLLSDDKEDYAEDDTEDAPESGDYMFAGVCGRLGQVTPIPSGVWRVLVVAPWVFALAVYLFPGVVGSHGAAWALVSLFLPPVLYVLLWLLTSGSRTEVASSETPPTSATSEDRGILAGGEKNASSRTSASSPPP